MSEVKQADLTLTDFALGDHDSPVVVDPAFTTWRNSVPEYHELFARPLAKRIGPRTHLRIGGKELPVINMASQDYLGLAAHPDITEAQVEALRAWGNGAGGTPLVSGLTLPQEELEAEMRTTSARSEALIYSSAYAAALGCCSGLLRRGDVAILDSKTHICWHEGARMATASVATFDHNDPRALDAVLKKHAGRRRLVIIDGLYSMDGDFARLPEILEVAEAHDVGVVVDEAHSVFADGPTGGGLTERLGLQHRVAVFTGTFSKAAGMIGGFICADADLIDYIRYYSRPYAFSAALPPAVFAGLAEAVRIARRATQLRESLDRKAARFREGVRAMGLDTGLSESWVVPVMVGDNREFLLEATRQLMHAGAFVPPIEFPAVPADALRMRFAINARHADSEIDEVLDAIERIVARPIRSGAPRVPRG